MKNIEGTCTWSLPLQLSVCCPVLSCLPCCRPRYWWWESVLLLQTLALVAAEVFGRALTPLQQALLLAAVLMAIGCVNGACSPIRCRLLVVLELMSLSVLSLTITLGLYFTGDDPVQGAAVVSLGGGTVRVAYLTWLNGC